MFEITPSAEFSAWFEALSPELAEEVACALDLLAEAGVALGPSHASRLLLWYDGSGRPGGAVSLEALQQRFGVPPGSYEGARDLVHWRHEVVRCLESATFRERLARLEPKAASVALLAVENLRVRLKALSKQLAFQHRSPEQKSAWGSELKESFFQVLRLVGLDPSPLMNSLSGLCELSIPSTDPPLRVLFGLDAIGQRIVALLGEPLTRSYYGDSVTLAEQRWQQYCSNPASLTALSQES
ncbi:MAG: hypothetical protein ABW061_10785 [Polyangiaceae bacterium]